MKADRIETETKLVVPDPAALGRLESVLRGLAKAPDRDKPPSGRPARVRLRGTLLIHDTYLDTEDWWFYRAGLACRIRRQRGPRAGREQAWLMLKELALPVEGPAVRFELEELLAEVPDGELTALPGTTLGGKLRQLVGRRKLRRLFDIHNRRTVYEVTRGPLRAEVCGDELTFQAAGRTESAAEIELECLAGTGRSLMSLAERLAEALPARKATQSKFQRGLLLAGLVPPKLPSLRVSPDEPTAEVARRALAVQFDRMQWYEPGARLGLDPEFAHQMRVAIRRFRTVLRVFARQLGTKPGSDGPGLRRRLADLSDALGRVRDLDVYLQNLPRDASVISRPNSPAVLNYQAHLTRRRDQARARLMRIIDSPRYTALLEDVRSFLRPPAGNAKDRDADGPIAGFARRAIPKRFRRLLRLGRSVLPDGSPEQLHQLRIRLRRLRYTAEVAEPFAGPQVRRFIRRLTRLQDALGRLQDAAVAVRLLEGFARTVSPPRRSSRTLLVDLGKLIGYQCGCQERRRTQAARQWARLDRKSVRRKLDACLDRAAAVPASRNPPPRTCSVRRRGRKIHKCGPLTKRARRRKEGP